MMMWKMANSPLEARFDVFAATSRMEVRKP